jgi:CheY-like chemotaxis protein
MYFNYTVVVVDDDDDDITLLRDALAENCSTATLVPLLGSDDFLHYFFGQNVNTENYLETVPWLIPDLILLDINMPKISGIQLLDCIRSHRALRDCKVVMLTTSTNQNDRVNCMLAGADLYLVKPSSFSELVEHCAMLLNDFLLAPRPALTEETPSAR